MHLSLRRKRRPTSMPKLMFIPSKRVKPSEINQNHSKKIGKRWKTVCSKNMVRDLRLWWKQWKWRLTGRRDNKLKTLCFKTKSWVRPIHTLKKRRKSWEKEFDFPKIPKEKASILPYLSWLQRSIKNYRLKVIRFTPKSNRLLTSALFSQITKMIDWKRLGIDELVVELVWTIITRESMKFLTVGTEEYYDQIEWWV